MTKNGPYLFFFSNKTERWPLSILTVSNIPGVLGDNIRTKKVLCK